MRRHIDEQKNEAIQAAAYRIEKQLTSPSVTFLLGAGIIGALIYVYFLLQPEYRGDILPYTIVIIAELFLITQGVLSFWTILSGRMNPRTFEYHHAQDNMFGGGGKRLARKLHALPATESRVLPLYLYNKEVTVDVFIPVYGEPVDVIEDTAIAARDMYGKHTTYILDDGKSDEVKQLAKRIDVGYIRRPSNKHAKAGNINYALMQTDGDLFVIFDADFVAASNFLYETVPFFESEKVSFVQTPQFYDNQINFVSTGAGYMQHVFYSLVQMGKNRFDAAFCVGTNVVFRRSAIEQIGGIYFQSKSEDIWTSLMLHENGFSTVYINNVLALGKTPETLKAYVKQQLRWATGSFEIFLWHNPLLAKKLTLDQRLQYFATTIFYFNGFAIGLLLLLPALQIYFNITPIALNIPVWQWALLYSGFYLMQLFLSVFTMGGLKLQAITLSAATFPVYIKAFFNALFRRDQAWNATNRVDKYDSPFNYIRIQVYVFIFLLTTTIVGAWKSMYTGEFSISLAWSALNAWIFGYFIYVALRESHQMRRITKTTIKKVKSLRIRTAS